MIIFDKLASKIVTKVVRDKLDLKTIDVELKDVYINHCDEQRLFTVGCKGVEVMIDDNELQELSQKLQLF